MNVTAFTLVGLLVLVGGCSKGAPSRMMQPREPAVVVRPADGETGVRLDAEIVLTFAAPVDAAVVESDVHLFSARDMADTLCPHEAMMPHGGMSEAMTEPTRMRHMEEFHRSPGAFAWSDGMRRCAFRPDSMMAPSTRHMIHFGPAAMDMMENRMDGAMMDGHGSGKMARHMMFHFVTISAFPSAGTASRPIPIASRPRPGTRAREQEVCDEVDAQPCARRVGREEPRVGRAR